MQQSLQTGSRQYAVINMFNRATSVPSMIEPLCVLSTIETL